MPSRRNDARGRSSYSDRVFAAVSVMITPLARSRPVTEAPEMNQAICRRLVTLVRNTFARVICFAVMVMRCSQVW